MADVSLEQFSARLDDLREDTRSNREALDGM
jgi:hypothetical protein